MNTDMKVFLYKELCYKILNAVYATRNAFGMGQKEKVYQNSFAEELNFRKIPFRREVSIVIRSPSTRKLVGNYRLDFVIDEKVIIEAKALKFIPAKLEQQLFYYLRSAPYEVGYLINFGATKLFIKRFILTNDRKYLFRSSKPSHNLSV